jgi:hypothetical protein
MPTTPPPPTGAVAETDAVRRSQQPTAKRHPDGWPVRLDDALASSLYAAMCGGADVIESQGLPVFGMLQEHQRDEYRAAADVARAFIAAERGAASLLAPAPESVANGDDVEVGARACHAAYVAERQSGKLHTPEDCPCRDGHDYSAIVTGAAACARCDAPKEHTYRSATGCIACRSAMRPWDALTEAARETFRQQARPVVEALRGRAPSPPVVAPESVRRDAEAVNDDAGLVLSVLARTRNASRDRQWAAQIDHAIEAQQRLYARLVAHLGTRDTGNGEATPPDAWCDTCDREPGSAAIRHDGTHAACGMPVRYPAEEAATVPAPDLADLRAQLAAANERAERAEQQRDEAQALGAQMLDAANRMRLDRDAALSALALAHETVDKLTDKLATERAAHEATRGGCGGGGEAAGEAGGRVQADRRATGMDALV